MGGDTEKHDSGLLRWFSDTHKHDGDVSQQMVSQLYASEDEACEFGATFTMIEYDDETTLDICSMLFDERVSFNLCVESSDEKVPLCLILLSGISVTDDMRVTPMDYMENANFQNSTDDKSCSIPPVCMEDEFIDNADETNTMMNSKRWNWSTDNYYFFPLSVAGLTYAKI